MKVKEVPIMQKISVIIIVIQILLIPIVHTVSFAQSNSSINTKLGTITIKYPDETLKVGDEAIIEIHIGEASLLSFYGQLKYDKDVFEIEKLSTAVKTVEGWTVEEGKENEDGKELFLYANDDKYAVSNTLIATINFRVISAKENRSDFYLNNMVLSDINYKDSTDEEGYGVSEKISLSLEKAEEKDPPLLPVDPETPEGPEEPEKPSEDPNNPTTSKLYLSSEKYKIGDNDIENYEKGDKYVSRVENETTKEEYINNLKTNGTIRIIKEDGTELEENELVGTGMILELTKDEEKIELKIAIMGDLNGDGKITPTDLSTLNQTILEMIKLEDEYKVAGDLDENENITVTDLSTLNKMVLKIQ